MIAPQSPRVRGEDASLQDHARVCFYKTVLDEAGIASFIRNNLANNIVDMPSPVFFPALCVVNDEDYDEAMRILGEIYYQKPSTATDWRCPKCQEDVPGTFESCWQCETLRPNPTNPNEPASNA